MEGLTPGEAKSKIIVKNPFFGSLLYNLPVVLDDTIPTLGVDGETLFYNPKFWDTLSRQEKYGVMMHEAGHLFLQHLWRGKNYTDIAVDPTSGQVISLFNLAGDAVINLMILGDTRFALPKNCFIDAKYAGWSTEEVYRDLQNNMKKMTQKQQEDFIQKFGGFCDKSRWGKGSPKEQKEQEEKWKERTKGAIEYAKSKGEEPAWMKRLYEEMQPKEDWRNILREYVQPFQNDYSFNPSDRRYLTEDFILPDIQEGTELNWIAIAVDTSGSIGQKELNSFVGEIKGILGAYDRIKAKLTFCDAEATPFVELQSFDEDKGKIQPKGGGGTSFIPVFNLIKKEENPPLVLVYMTDLMGDFPNKKPEYTTLWIATAKGQAPFGKILPYNIT